MTSREGQVFRPLDSETAPWTCSISACFYHRFRAHLKTGTVTLALAGSVGKHRVRREPVPVLKRHVLIANCLSIFEPHTQQQIAASQPISE
jgi:hypothetical protein